MIKCIWFLTGGMERKVINGSVKERVNDVGKRERR